MRTPLQFLLAAAAAVAVIACNKADDATIQTTSAGETNQSPSADAAESRDRAMVRFVNAANGPGMLALRMSDSTLFDNVKSASVTDFREVSNTMGRFSARMAGSGDTTTLATNDEVLADGNRYSVIMIADDVANRTLRVVKDEVIPDSGMARIRVIHAAQGGPELDIRPTNSMDELFSDINFKSEAGYKDVQPATMGLEIRADGQSKVLLTIPPMTLTRGTATTIVITGATKLGYFMFTDAMMPAAASR